MTSDIVITTHYRYRATRPGPSRGPGRGLPAFGASIFYPNGIFAEVPQYTNTYGKHMGMYGHSAKTTFVLTPFGSR